VAIVVREKKNALLVPDNAVKESMVELVRDGKNIPVKVKTRSYKDGWVEILEGDVRATDSIVIR
jgi:hypothetical protein